MHQNGLRLQPSSRKHPELAQSTLNAEMIWDDAKTVVRGVYEDVVCNHTMAFAAGLSFYFLLALFPLLISMAATLAYLPIPNLFNSILDLMARLVPGEAMTMVRQIIVAILTPPHGGLLSLGFVGTLWAASGGFSAMMESLNVAYDVQETRPYYRTRSLALGLTFIVGLLVTIGLCMTLLGPRFGEILKNHHKVGPLFAMVWPAIRWALIGSSIILAVEVIYFWVPNVKQKFWHTLPGAVFGVAGGVGGLPLFGLYVPQFAPLKKNHWGLGGGLPLVVWVFL